MRLPEGSFWKCELQIGEKIPISHQFPVSGCRNGCGCHWYVRCENFLTKIIGLKRVRIFVEHGKIKSLNKIIGKNIKPQLLPVRAGDVFRTSADISKISKLLKFKPLVSFEDGLKKTVAYFKAKF